ncbi:MAG: glutamate racemase [Spirochaetes bacterium]|nr:glutamate racemase [Spirochaetota bacterium]
MNRAPIVFVDSGVGGLPYLEAARALVPDAPFVYIADTGHFPYGSRGEDDIRAIVLQLVDRAISRFDPSLVVLACNTASVVALAALRERYEVPFVGVVPAVKPAAREAGARGMVILSTSRTADGEYLAGLVDDYAAGTPVSIVPAGGLVDFVERRFASDTADEARAAVREAISGGDLRDVDAVVLGCTHFTHLAAEIQREFGPWVRVIDSRAGVARRVAELAGADAAVGGGDGGGSGYGSSGDGGGGSSRLYITDSGEGPEAQAAAARYRALAAIYGLSFEGRFA